MNKRYFAVMLAFLVILVSGCSKDHQEETVVPTQIPQVTQAAQATVESTEEATIPGLEDSVFGDELDEATAVETVPATEANTGNAHGGGNIREPDAPNAPDTPSSKPQETQKPEATQPVTEPETEPETEPQTPETAPPSENRSEYEKFQNMSAADQQEYMSSFDSIEEFFNWYNGAREEHEQMFPDIEISDGVVDMDQILGGNN